MSEKNVRPIYRITVEVTRDEVGRTEREYKKLRDLAEGEDPKEADNYGYTSQVIEVQRKNRKIVDIELVNLNTKELMKAIIEHGDPVEGDLT